MKAKLVQIGNSRGIRLPKLLIDQVGLADEIDLEVREGQIVISASEPARSDWAAAARSMADRREDAPLDPYVESHFDGREWKW
jgi:antitoxin MazE